MKKYRTLKFLFKPVLKRATRQVVQGRFLDPDQPEKGRFLRNDLDNLLIEIWQNVDVLLPVARLDQLPTFGNRLNVYLAVVTTAGYRAMLKKVEDPDYAATLIGDAGWKIYSWMILLASWPYRLTSRNPQKRIDRTIRALLIFPFSAPGRPGYEVQIRSTKKGLETHWTHCPPQTFVRELLTQDPDNGELDAFYKSWCLYDWPGADLIVDDGSRNHYARPKTMSRGASVCDMCWMGNTKG